MTYDWTVEVTISGVPSVTPAELKAVMLCAPGVIQHDADTGKLLLVWWCSTAAPSMLHAMTAVMDTCRRVFLLLASAVNPECTGVRVRRYREGGAEEEARAQPTLAEARAARDGLRAHDPGQSWRVARGDETCTVIQPDGPADLPEQPAHTHIHDEED